MKKTVRRRHNQDGSVTTTTTYRRKNMFGTTISETYTERTEPNSNKQAANTPAAKGVMTFLGVFIMLIGVLCLIPLIKWGWKIMLVPSFFFLIVGFACLPINYNKKGKDSKKDIE